VINVDMETTMKTTKQPIEKRWTVTFTAGNSSRSFDMIGTREGARKWARRERHYFAPGAVARYKVVAA
jgi:hypothetical protein